MHTYIHTDGQADRQTYNAYKRIADRPGLALHPPEAQHRNCRLATGFSLLFCAFRALGFRDLQFRIFLGFGS